MDGCGSIAGKGERFFSTPQDRDRLWGPPTLLYNGYQGVSPRIKRQGREAYHSLPRSITVELYLHSSNVFMGGAKLIKHRDNFALPLYL
jgi:hypothetical protein